MPYYFFDQNSSFGTKVELKTMVSTLKDKKVQVIEDVVLNHHASLNQQDMFTFPRDDQWTPDAGDTHTYTYLKANTPYILTPRDIVKDDDDNGTQEYADYLNATITDDANKIKLSPTTVRRRGPLTLPPPKARASVVPATSTTAP